MNLFFSLTFYYRGPAKDSESRGNIFLPYTGVQICFRALAEVYPAVLGTVCSSELSLHAVPPPGLQWLSGKSKSCRKQLES